MVAESRTNQLLTSDLLFLFLESVQGTLLQFIDGAGSVIFVKIFLTKGCILLFSLSTEGKRVTVYWARGNRGQPTWSSTMLSMPHWASLAIDLHIGKQFQSRHIFCTIWHWLNSWPLTSRDCSVWAEEWHSQANIHVIHSQMRKTFIFFLQFSDTLRIVKCCSCHLFWKWLLMNLGSLLVWLVTIYWICWLLKWQDDLLFWVPPPFFSLC